MTKTAQDLLLQRIEGVVLPLVRFDRASLQMIATDAASVPVTARQSYTANFWWEQSSTTGRWTAGSRVSNREELSSTCNRLIARVGQTAPEFLERWRRNSPSPQEQLRPMHCFESIAPIGYDTGCGSCVQGKIGCTQCDRSGSVSCYSCYGRRTCSSCSGDGHMRCGNCGGSGNVFVSPNTQSCGTCGGSGSKTCFGCNGSGKCTGCDGSGTTTCSGCGGRGTVTCTRCAGTGWLSHSAILRCQVTEAVSLDVASDVEEVRRTMAVEGATIVGLYRLAPVALKGYRIDGAKLESEFDGVLAYASVDLQVGTSTLRIVGYGKQLEIFDHKNLVGALLQEDLDDLGSALKAAPRLPFGSMGAVTEALKNCLLSKVNSDLLETSSPKGSGPPPSDPTLGQLVSPEYSSSARNAVQKAVLKVYGTAAWPGSVLSIAIALVVMLALTTLTSELLRMDVTANASLLSLRQFLTPLSASGEWEQGIVALALGMITGTIATWLSVRGLVTGFGNAAGPRLRRAFATTWVARKRSAVNLTLALAGVVIVVAMSHRMSPEPAATSWPKSPAVQPRVPTKATTPSVVEPKETHRNKTSPKSANGYGGVVIQPSKETSHPDSVAQLRPYLPQFAFLIGEWESLTPGNHYHMRVDWDSPNKQFRGYLTKQGQTSENVGFQLGELVWIAEPSSEHIFIEQQKWRKGANGTPSGYEWRNRNFDVERSSLDHLVSSQEFMRVR